MNLYLLLIVLIFNVSNLIKYFYNMTINKKRNPSILNLLTLAIHLNFYKTSKIKKSEKIGWSAIYTEYRKGIDYHLPGPMQYFSLITSNDLMTCYLRLLFFKSFTFQNPKFLKSINFIIFNFTLTFMLS